MSSKQDELRNLMCTQRREVPDSGLYGKLSFEDLKRIDRLTSGDITLSNECCLYNGNTVGNKYCTFSFRGKKTSLIRTLYHNLVENIEPDMKPKWSCKNKGICCNLSHFKMILDVKDKNTPEKEEISDSEQDFPANEKNHENIFKFDEL